MRHSKGIALFILCLPSLAACGAGRGLPPDTVRLESGERSEVDRYMPLEDGLVYAYRTRAASGEAGIMTIQVQSTDRSHVDLEFGGHRESLVLDAGGARFADGGYFLKAPLTIDNSWQGRLGLVRIVAKDVEVTVPAGHFVGCIRTEERDRMQTATIVTSVYCPHAGLALLDVSSASSRATAALEHMGARSDELLGTSPAVAEE